MMRRKLVPVTVVVLGLSSAGPAWTGEPTDSPARSTSQAVSKEEPHGSGHVEAPRDKHLETPPQTNMSRQTVLRSRDGFLSVQVNVDALGNNISGDAANEPSIAVDPTDLQRISIGWRQFDNVGSDFRQAGWAFTGDGGNTWTFPGVIEPGVFRSDPVLDADAEGNFYYNSLTADAGPSNFRCHVFKSTDGGVTWDSGVYAHGGDKQWQVIDTTNGVGRGNIYAAWNSSFSSCSGNFTRSYDNGQTFLPCSTVAGNPYWGTMAVGPDGELYVSGTGMTVAKSTTMQDSGQSAAWDFSRTVDLDGSLGSHTGPNPGGLLGQNWIAVDHSDGTTRGNVYMLASVNRSSNPDPLDVMFARSTDGGVTWSPPVRVNDDPGTSAWQWFGTMSVAPNGRIDAIWLDTRNDPGGFDSELYYSFSTDAGETWSPNQSLTPSFDPHLGWPQQNKMGDYFDMISDDLGASLAFAGTFNGEQDVYFIRIGEPACPHAGRLILDRPKYTCDGEVAVELLDCDLNTDDDAVESVTVAIDSDSETGFEEVVLTESHPASARFEGSIALTETDGDGVLLVTEGDTVTVTYLDADDGEGGIDVVVTAQATVECTPPVISNVRAIDVEPRSATVTFDTDEPTRGIVHYGQACVALDETTNGSGFETSPVVGLSGLEDDSAYFFAVDAEDEAGNLATDDNGGACHTFTTLDIPDFMTEQFAGDFDLAPKSATFTPNGSVDFYSRCVEPLFDGLPTDPAGGTDSGLGDDLPTSFALQGGATVQLYGQSHDTVFVGPNGYVTFGEGDSDFTESLADHFDLPRVTGYWNDLDPGEGGSVSWKQLLDRIAVTWLDVPEHNQTNANTFQIEMFFDGRIRLSWIQVDSQEGIVGLSEGNGLDPDFFESDLSFDSDCGPRPPFTQPMSVQTGVSLPLSIELEASDDGLPAPPELSFVIATLPSFGTLRDEGTGTLIMRVPYDLDGTGDRVIYTPVNGFQGTDLFTYQADDGGTPPDGGLSARTDVAVFVGGRQPIHEFLVDDTDPGFSTAGDWSFGPPTGGGSHDGDPASGYTGDNVYGYNLDGDYTNDMPARFLTSPALDLTGITDTVLEYRRWLGVDNSALDDVSVLVRTGGFVFETAWSHDGAAISESAWSLQSHDISSFADDEPQVFLYWVMGATNGSVTYPGWNLDDIRVLGVLPESICDDAPAEVPFVGFRDAQTLLWVPPVDSGGVAPAYDTLRSVSALDFEAGTSCVESDDDSDTEAVDAAIPLSGESYFYLIRAETPCGDGDLGRDSSGTPRTAIDCAAP